MTARKDYQHILWAAKYAGIDVKLWCRYMRKCFVDCEPIITPEEVEKGCRMIPPEQAEVVREIMTPGTELYEHTRTLDAPAGTPILDAVREKVAREKKGNI